MLQRKRCVPFRRAAYIGGGRCAQFQGARRRFPYAQLGGGRAGVGRCDGAAGIGPVGLSQIGRELQSLPAVARREQTQRDRAAGVHHLKLPPLSCGGESCRGRTTLHA